MLVIDIVIDIGGVVCIVDCDFYLNILMCFYDFFKGDGVI